MPVHHRGHGCYQWGHHGKVYCGRGARQKAERQGRAAYFHGYRGHEVNVLAASTSHVGVGISWKYEAEGIYRALINGAPSKWTAERNDNEPPSSDLHWMLFYDQQSPPFIERSSRNELRLRLMSILVDKGINFAPRAARSTSMRADEDGSEQPDEPSIYIKAGEVDLYVIDDDGECNTIVFPSDYGMAHDVSGESLDECSLFFGPVRVSQERVDPIPEKAAAYFGEDYDAKIAVIDVPTQGWNLVGHVEEIVYFRPGKYEEVWRHPFEPPQPLFKSGDWFQMQLPDDCVLTWKGIERP